MSSHTWALISVAQHGSPVTDPTTSTQDMGPSCSFVIRPLGSLPWPATLGKCELRSLELRLRAYLGNSNGDPGAHRRAMQTRDPGYLAIVSAELTDRTLGRQYR